MKPLGYRLVFVVTALLGFFLPVAAFAHGGHKAEHNHPFPRKKFSVQKGRALYNTYCAACHGVNGNGKGPAAAPLKPPPTNFLDLRYMTMKSRVDHYNAILKGRPKTAMTAWKKILSAEQIWSVVAYIEHLFNHRWDAGLHPRGEHTY